MKVETKELERKDGGKVGQDDSLSNDYRFPVLLPISEFLLNTKIAV